MRRSLFLRLFARAIAAAITLSALVSGAQAQLPLGATAPAFTKSLLGGGTVSPVQYQGKVVVLFLLGYA
jgi:predicted histidine transporter YuiF (NhaC family)